MIHLVCIWLTRTLLQVGHGNRLNRRDLPSFLAMRFAHTARAATQPLKYLALRGICTQKSRKTAATRPVHTQGPRPKRPSHGLQDLEAQEAEFLELLADLALQPRHFGGQCAVEVGAVPQQDSAHLLLRLRLGESRVYLPIATGVGVFVCARGECVCVCSRECVWECTVSVL